MSKDATSSSGTRMASGGGFFTKAGNSLSRANSKRHRVRGSSVPAEPFSLDHDGLTRPSLARNEPSFSGSTATNDSSNTKTPDKEIDARSIGLVIPPSTTSAASTAPPSAVDRKSPPDMIAAPFGNNLKRAETAPLKPPGSSYGNVDFGGGVPLPTGSLPPPTLNGAGAGSQNPGVLYQYIHDMASKRISTLDYLRKAHEGRVYWFNTVHFAKADLARIPYFEPRKLARRATNYLLLGLSLPTILDLNCSSPLEYLRALNALLVEFEAFQQVHPPDGSTTSSLSRARIPHMFKRATTHTKSRRTSSATEIGLPMHASTSDPSDIKSMASSANTSTATPQSATISSFPSTSFDSTSSDLHPGEEYIHLLTPSLPFDPDFYETFATLCDVLIDCYTKIVGLISSPAVCSPAVGETFGKADARLRKVIVVGVVQEFEHASRTGVKSELAGVGKVVLGGLMGG